MEKIISILIVNWNTKKFLRKCILSIFNNVKLPFEIIVVDNNSLDGSKEMLEKNWGEWIRKEKIKLIKNKENLGFSRGNNQAFYYSKGKYVLVLNPDVEILPNSIERMVGFLENHRNAGMVAPAYLNPDGGFQYHYRRFPTFLSAIFYFTFFGSRYLTNTKTYRNYLMLDDNFQKSRLLEQPGASCVLLKRELIKKIGFFDVKFPILFTDTDLCKRIYGAGYKIYYLPEAKAIHYRSATLRQIEKRELRRISAEGLTLYFQKHHGKFLAMMLKLILLIDAFLWKFYFKLAKFLLK
jgi:hypothetical protein